MTDRLMRLSRVFVLSLATASPALAQGTLSTQGLGFPPGQLSTPAASMGGAIGEADPMSPLNPAAIGLAPAPVLFMQAEPEFRTLTSGGRTQRTSVSRFPLFIGILPLGARWAVSASAATLLDRTWATITRDTQVVNASDTLASDLQRKSDGSIADLRLAVSFAATTWLRVGLGMHTYSGRDLISNVRTFDDTLHFARDTQVTTISFGGNAVSLGMQTFWPRIAAVGLDYRKGGTFRTYLEGTPLNQATAPDHFGVSAVYLGLQGASIGVRAAKDTWSSMQGVDSTMHAHEGWDVGVGADVTGPRLGGSPIALRAGGRWRTLPFSAGLTAVQEHTWSGGIGFPMARGRAELNLGVLRSSRSGDAGISEGAWIISTGFAVRP